MSFQIISQVCASHVGITRTNTSAHDFTPAALILPLATRRVTAVIVPDKCGKERTNGHDARDDSFGTSWDR